MSRVEENRKMIEYITKITENQQTGTCEQIVAWNAGNIAAFLTDISKSLAVIADSCVKKEEENGNSQEVCGI